jgi:hypothetical protein
LEKVACTLREIVDRVCAHSRDVLIQLILLPFATCWKFSKSPGMTPLYLPDPHDGLDFSIADRAVLTTNTSVELEIKPTQSVRLC